MCRILVVDDHADSAAFLTRLLAAEGHEVRTAASVEAAKALCQTNVFDLLISDIGLPDGSGYELMQHLRGRGVRGIALSGRDLPDDIQASLHAGFEMHLVKPVVFSELATAIARLTAPRRADAPPSASGSALPDHH